MLVTVLGAYAKSLNLLQRCRQVDQAANMQEAFSWYKKKKREGAGGLKDSETVIVYNCMFGKDTW